MLKILIDNKFSAIIEAACYWLGYQFKIGRNQLIHEASLRYPIADTLTSKGIDINRIVLEQLHPIFKSKKIDLVIFDKNVINPNDEKDDNKLNEVFELKIAKSDTGRYESIEHQRVFDDIARLAYYNKWRKKACYFLMCGKYEDFKAYFVEQINEVKEEGERVNIKERFESTEEDKSQKDNSKWQPNGLYEKWFGFIFGEEKEHEFSITDIHNSNEWGLQAFKQNYIVRKDLNYKIDDSLKIKTTCLAITSPGLEKSRTHAAGIWKIEAI
jgi:hypothetical protein